MYENGLIKKIRLIYDVTTWLTNNCNTQISQCSRSKENQTMKFGQLIDYNMRNIFAEKSYTKCGGETIPRHFSKTSELSLSQCLKVLYFLFLFYGYLRAIEI